MADDLCACGHQEAEHEVVAVREPTPIFCRRRNARPLEGVWALCHHREGGSRCLCPIYAPAQYILHDLDDVIAELGFTEDDLNETKE